ncbi:wax ester/triacylglycerol synthase domain-containing protein [Diaminobutyricimonas sp. TR449]|uniref:wax ester/triacylglycerol synthase domain-containing protein n=1 Tax=Diaminobutyricimonas sp. TR449 TaxID=2708076 RepID=UPI001FB93A8C|nr:wax ester/triacylglycerol synthase domain-containing protein [Diaminobutyricimonas sp. TR449]
MRTAKPRIAAVDQANLVLDHTGQVNVFLVAGLLANEGFVGADGAVDMARLRTAVGERIASRPQLSKLSVVVGRGHHWAEATPDLRHHIRITEAVDGVEGLERLCGELMSAPLPRDRPMWELLLVPGTGVGRIAVVLRIHHAIADGMAAVAIVRQLFESEAESRMPAPEPVVTELPRPQQPTTHRNLRRTLGKFAFGLSRMRMTSAAGRSQRPCCSVSAARAEELRS